MIISIIENPKFVYFNLHAEEVISSNYLNDDNQGIYISSLQFETVNRIYKFLFEKPLSTKSLVFDLNYLEHIQPNIFDKIIEIRDLGYHLSLINVSKTLIHPLSLKTIVNPQNNKNITGGYDIFYFHSEVVFELYKEKIDAGMIFYKHFKEILSDYIDEYKKAHASSFIYLHSFVDIKRLISNDTKLFYFALYRLAVKIRNKWQEQLKDNPILVSQSLTSSFVVSILSKLLKLDILVFDKIGPITKLYNKLEKHNFENRKYIIVSDLVCLGTEVKITKNLIEFSGGKYLGNVSIVKVETLSRDDLSFNNIDRTIAVFSISNKNNSELNYYIYTNLSPLDE